MKEELLLKRAAGLLMTMTIYFCYKYLDQDALRGIVYNVCTFLSTAMIIALFILLTKNAQGFVDECS